MNYRMQNWIATFILILTSLASGGESPFVWEKLPAIPDEHGFAGPYGGIIKGNLIVAGGANFPDSPPWEGGNKVWYDKIFVLPRGATEWQVAEERLPQPLAYGVSLSLPDRDSIAFIGGSNQNNEPVNTAFELRYNIVGAKMTPLPDLPVALAEFSGVLFKNRIYVFSGRSTKGTVPKAYRLNLRKKKPVWEDISWPSGARGRMHCVTGVLNGKIYLFGGRDFMTGDSIAHREDRMESIQLDFLRDCWSLDPGTLKWTRLSDLPRGMSAAPWSAVPAGNSHLVMLGGVDADFIKSQIVARPEVNGQGFDHPGFPPTQWAYHTTVDSWSMNGDIAYELEVPVTAPVIKAGGNSFIIPSGEVKPGVRTTQVIKGKLRGTRAEFGLVNWIVVAVYLGLMVLIGYIFMKSESASSTDGYFRGGQRVPWWVAGLSIFATMLSAITFMAIPAKAYSDDMNYWIGNWAIVAIVPVVVIFYLPYFRKLNVTTAYEFLEQRFSVSSRLIASALFMLFHIGRVAIVLYLPALAISSVTDINIYVAILAIGILCIIYTVMGGIEAVVWTDALQAVVLLCGALICLFTIIFAVDGGVVGIFDIARQDSKLLTANWFSLDLSSSTTSGLIIFLGFFFASLPSYTAGQDVVQRYVTTPDEKSAARSLWLNIPLALFGSVLFFSLGVALYVFYKTQPELLDVGLERNDGILPFFVLQNVPVGVAGLIVAGIFAASQSTISSSLNSVATAFVTDFYIRWRPDTSDRHRLNVAKRVVIFLGFGGILLAAAVAATGMKSAFDAFNTFIGMALGPVGGMFFLGVFVKRAKGSSALIGAIVGFLTILLIHYLRGLGIFDLWPILYGMISFSITVVVGAAVGATAEPPSSSKW